MVVVMPVADDAEVEVEVEVLASRPTQLKVSSITAPAKLSFVTACTCTSTTSIFLGDAAVVLLMGVILTGDEAAEVGEDGRERLESLRVGVGGSASVERVLGRDGVLLGDALGEARTALINLCVRHVRCLR